MQYDDWKTGYYEGKEDRECPKQKKLDSASYWVESIVDRLYSKDTPLDPFSLECDLDELCHILGVKINTGDLQIQAKTKKPVDSSASEFLNIFLGN